MELLRFIQNLADDDKLIPKIRACWKKLITDCVKEFKPDIASITCMFTMCHPNTKDICKHLKNENPDLPILAGGVHVTNAPEIFLEEKPEVDFFFQRLMMGKYLYHMTSTTSSRMHVCL